MKPKTAIFCSNGTKGDVLPLLAIAHALRCCASVEIVFLLNDIFRELTITNGFSFESTGGEQIYQEVHSDGRLWSSHFDAMQIMFRRLVRPAFEKSYDFVKKQYANNGGTLVISNNSLYDGALLASEELSCPSVALTLAPFAVPSDLEPSAPLAWHISKLLPLRLRRRKIRRAREKYLHYVKSTDYFWQMNAFRRAAGRAMITNFSIDTLFPQQHFHIALFPEWYSTPMADWPAHMSCVGFPQWSTKNGQIESEVERFIRQYGKPLLFTSGTGYFDTQAFFEDSIDIANHLGTAALLVGGDRPRHQKLPPHILYLAEIDFDSVFPKCSAVIHHGGIGTLAAALRAGVPQIIRPLAFDQYDNADRLHRFGLGRFFLPQHYASKAVAKALRHLWADKAVENRLRQVAQNVRQTDGAEKAAQRIIARFWPQERG